MAGFHRMKPLSGFVFYIAPFHPVPPSQLLPKISIRGNRFHPDLVQVAEDMRCSHRRKTINRHLQDAAVYLPHPRMPTPFPAHRPAFHEEPRGSPGLLAASSLGVVRCRRSVPTGNPSLPHKTRHANQSFDRRRFPLALPSAECGLREAQRFDRRSQGDLLHILASLYCLAI